jgi:outer membrane receptor protein involved in Fe transport
MKFFRSLLIAFLIFAAASVSFGQMGRIDGKVIDQRTQLPLSGANVAVTETSLGATTNGKGLFSIAVVPDGEHAVRISFLGYKTETLSIRLDANGQAQMEVALQPIAIPLVEVLVTSEKYEKRLGDVSLPLSVVKEEKITQTAPVGISNVLQSEPGISLARDGIWGTHLSIRGLSKTNIVTLVDGNRIDTATDLAAGLSLIDVYDIQRVEVIKGAASSLYGTGATGGVVNIITNDGWYADRRYAEARLVGGYSSVNQSGMGHAMLNLGATKWYLKLSGLVRNAGDTQTPQGVLANSQYKDDNVSGKIGFKPWQNQELRINYQRYYAEDVGIPGGYPLFPNPAEVRYPKEKRELFSTEYTVSKLRSFLPRFSVKYYAQNILRDTENIPHTVQNIAASNGQPPKRVSVLRIAPGATHDLQGFQSQADWVIGNRQHFITGVDIWQKDLDSYRTRELKTEILDPANGSVKQTINKVIGEKPLPNASYRSMGFYGQDEVRIFSNRLLLTLGGRLDQINVENEQVLNPLYEITNGVRTDSPATQVVLWRATKAHDRSWSGNIGIVLNASKSLNFTFTAAKSFRSPYLEERYLYVDLGNLIKIGDPDLKPEKGVFFDLGARYFRPNFSFSANVFINNLDDLLVDAPATFEGRPALKKTNVGQARLYGFDLRSDFQPFSALGFYASAAYVHGEDTFTNTPLPLIPPLNGRLGIQSSIGRYLSLEVAAVLFDDQDRIAQGEFYTPGYKYFNAYASISPITLAGMRSGLYFGIENMLNRSYRNHLATNRGTITAEPGRNFSVLWEIEI